MSNPIGSPTCFGQWSASAVDCTGGPDASYVNPKNGTTVRDKCGWFGACASTRMQPQPQLVQIRPNVQPPPRPAPPMVQRPTGFIPQPQYPQIVTQQQQHQLYTQQYAQQQQHAPQYQQPVQYQQAVPHYGVQYAPPFVAQQGPTFVAVPYQQPGHQMPSYLTVPEPVDLRESGWKRLGREVLRSMFKSAGHTTSSYFDHNPMRPHEGPRLPPNIDSK